MAIFGPLAAKIMGGKSKYNDDEESLGHMAGREAGLLAAGGATEQVGKAVIAGGKRATKLVKGSKLGKYTWKTPRTYKSAGKAFLGELRHTPKEAALAGMFGAGLGAAEYTHDKWRKSRGMKPQR